jgi:uroporphyrinogen decarboxylase
LNSRERILAAINLMPPDRVPLYFGGTSSFLTDEAYFILKEYLGIQGDVEPYREGHTGNIFDQRILEALDVDVRFVYMKKPDFFKYTRLDRDTILSDWGIPIRNIDGYGVRVNPPLANATIEDIALHAWPDAYDPGRTEGLEQYAKYLREHTDKAVVARAPQSASFLEYGCWLRGTEQFFMDMVLDQEFVTGLLDKILDIQIKFYDAFLQSVGKYVDIVETSEDYGTQTGLLISPELFRSMIKPRRKAINDFIKSKCPHVKILHHSCGAIEGIIDDLIECGVDILNPIQPLGAKMDPADIKMKYGKKICLCGGIDMQKAMLGDISSIENEVKLRIQQMAEGGGYLLCTSNHVQRDTPPSSVIELYRMAKKYGLFQK